MRYNLGMSHLKSITERIAHANKKHPEGPSFDALTDEVIELREAISQKDEKQIIYELYDVVTVGLRLIMAYQAKKIKI